MTPERVQVLSLGEMADVERQLEPTFEVHRATGAEIDGLVTRRGPGIRAVATRGRDRLDAALLARLPALEIIANFGVGYDSIDVDAAARRGIVVTNTPEVLNDEVADFAVALLLATVRRLPQADRFVRSGRWLQGNFPLGPTLRDRTVGLIGMGRIGKRIAQRLAAFEVPIVYHSRTARTDVPIATTGSCSRWRKTWTLSWPSYRAAPPPRPDRRRGPRGARAGRHPDQRRPRLGGRRAGARRGAAQRDDPRRRLDVFADEPRVPQALLELDNVVLLPHVGSATRHTRGLMGRLVVDNLLSWFEGRGALTPVPETSWPRKA